MPIPALVFLMPMPSYAPYLAEICKDAVSSGKFVFATALTGPRINACSYSDTLLLKLHRGKIYTAFYNIYHT
jgi:hypothetical protein